MMNLILPSKTTRAGVLVAGLGLYALLLLVSFNRFVINMLADRRLPVSRETLAWGAARFPGSARLQARLAEAELGDGDLPSAESGALRSISISPFDHTLRLLLAEIEESKGDREAAESSLKAAVALAPQQADVHWRLANLLIRRGEVNESLPEFRQATTLDESLLPFTFDLVWQVSKESLDAVDKVTSHKPKARVALAQFLLKRARVEEAAGIFGQIDRPDQNVPIEARTFLDALIAGGHIALARNLWCDVLATSRLGSCERSTLVSNGSFESDIFLDFAQFDWMISPSDYSQISIDRQVARTGSRSLRIDFLGRDTTRLDREIKQLTLVQPGVLYRLECYAKTEGLISPEGPSIAVAEPTTYKIISSSDPVPSGSNDWQRLTVDFASTQSSSQSNTAVYLMVKRIPRFSYDDPTRGTIWLDDFTLRELSSGK